MKIITISIEFIRRRFFMISWISLVLYLFCTTYNFYLEGRQFYHLRQILGLGLCISRGTANVLNLCSALVLLPLCKKLNQVLYRVLSGTCPAVFFFWLEKAKSFHMTVAITLMVFAVIHSISHFVNLWNFSRGYDEERREINFANYRNENPLLLLMSQAGLTGVTMLLIICSMALTSLRPVRRRLYNAFWYTHRLYILFLGLLIVHPLRGILKEEVLPEETPAPSHLEVYYEYNTTDVPLKFVAIKSWTWLWMALPLSCFLLDLIWRVLSRNRAIITISDVSYMPGRTLSLSMSPPERLVCRPGQYVLLQCPHISVLEWHPFTVVKVPESSQSDLVVWIRVKGDWTEALERLLLEKGASRVSMLVDGPLASPMCGASGSEVAMCVAAGVGITPFVSLLQRMLMNPKSPLPGRIHLLWIVRYEEELTWLADLATKTMWHLRESNRPDRLHLELYVTNTKDRKSNRTDDENVHVVTLNNKGGVDHVRREFTEDEKATLLTPNLRRSGYVGVENKASNAGEYSIAKEYPLLGCRVRRGRPHWDRVFGYWVHLYPQTHLNLYCCGPKKLVKLLRNKSKCVSRTTKTKFTFVHEGFS